MKSQRIPITVNGILSMICLASCVANTPQEKPRREAARQLLRDEHVQQVKVGVLTEEDAGETPLEGVWVGTSREDFETFPFELGPLAFLDRATLRRVDPQEVCIALRIQDDALFSRSLEDYSPRCLTNGTQSEPSRQEETGREVMELWYERKNVEMNMSQTVGASPDQRSPLLVFQRRRSTDEVVRVMVIQAEVCCATSEPLSSVELDLQNDLYGTRDGELWYLRYRWERAP